MTGHNMEEKTYKEQLSKHVENIFRNYTTPGLHICDIATGGGKSYTIGKLTCEYYPKHFDRIIILCVQNKLVEGMKREIRRFLDTPLSLIKEDDILHIENNTEVIKKAIGTGSFQSFINKAELRIGELKTENRELKYECKRIKKTFEGLKNLILTQSENNNDLIQNQITEGESKLRRDVRNFFETYKKAYTNIKNGSRLDIGKDFPDLINAYPQIDYKKKKVLLMTVQKAMYGIDPILSEKIKLQDMTEKNKRTLILFDESDQAAITIRDAIIAQSIHNAGGSKRFAKGYNGYLQYKQLTDMANHVSDEYYGNLLVDRLKKASKEISTNWENTLGKTEPYKNIFLGDIEDMEDYRRGVFFSGPALKLNISKSSDKNHSFICYKKGEKQFKLFHADDEAELNARFDYVVPMDKFLSLIVGNTTAIKAQLSKIVNDAFLKSVAKFEKMEDDLAANKLPKNHYLGYPTKEREIHTLFSRFEISSEYQFEQQLLEFMTNRKNIIVHKGDKKIKLPDYSVYSQGLQLYQEEIDERDNQHRIRLSCREISTTPEKIVLDLLRTEGTSVVLCSATASSSSVISNFDIKYLKESIGNKVHTLSEEDRATFDNFVSLTYPNEHRIEIQPLEHFYFDEKREDKWKLPEKFKKMFSKEARKEGLDERWFKYTRRELEKNKKEKDKISFSFYRLFQFIEAYHWFINHNDIRSMIFFQNRIGDPLQTNVLSCLIDGSYKYQNTPFEDELPTDWKNRHIRISKDWEEVEDTILKQLSESKDSKIMLVSAYASFKAGTNMQYEIPEGLDYIAGDNWDTEGGQLKKDWDAIYVQSPAGYLMMNEDNESTYENSLYNAMLKLMMLYERGCLSKNEVASWLCKALSNNFMFGDKENPGIWKDKSAWAQTIIEQAIGRLCRTRNKPHTTYILFDRDMAKFFDRDNLNKSLTKEFHELAEYILNMPNELSSDVDPEEIVRCNNANYAKRQLDRMRNIALRYTPHPDKMDDYDDDIEDGAPVPRVVEINQFMNQSYKQTIIKKPVIANFDELSEEDKYLPFICKCYGNWPRNEKNEYSFSYDPDHRNIICPKEKGRPYPEPISPSSVRLDILMKNNVIRRHFELNGFATDWKTGGLILHPEILKTDYAGEIGEEAFKAIVLEYTNCKENDIIHLEGRDYEYADFVIHNSDGTYKIAFDVKNMNPLVEHNDKQGELATKDKRKIKRERLGCQIITVNMLKLPYEPMDVMTEIHGIIDNDGNIIQSAIDRLKKLIG